MYLRSQVTCARYGARPGRLAAGGTSWASAPGVSAPGESARARSGGRVAGGSVGRGRRAAGSAGRWPFAPRRLAGTLFGGMDVTSVTISAVVAARLADLGDF